MAIHQQKYNGRPTEQQLKTILEVHQIPKNKIP
jgi:hypothetical protein